jgi:hypothetical protein
MTFKSTIETLSDVSILREAELDRVTGGMIKNEGPERPRGTSSGGGGDLIDNRWSQHPVYLGPF